MSAERAVSLATLVERLPAATVAGNLTAAVTGIETDSHAVGPGKLFVALRGAQTDGHRYVAHAVANGAAAVVVEDDPLGTAGNAVVVRVADARRALSFLAATFYGQPSQRLDVIGITGTNGKTTATRMVAAIFNEAGVSCGVVGTVGAQLGAQTWQLANTTPLPPELQRLLAQMRDAGAKAVAIEVSSHALALERVEDVRFRIAALTNVTRDHLDFHQTVEAYAAAKRRLFSMAERSVLNLDDAYGARWAAELQREGKETITYGLVADATLRPQSLAVNSAGSRFTVDGQSYELLLPGRFNVWNALAAIGIARLQGIDDATSARGLQALERIPGRMERLDANGVDVVVDYAHTPDALESALQALRESTRGALAVVFGCGGDRDKGKRAEMGAVAARWADRIYVTSDNPRGEEPSAIASAIVSGVGSREHVVELDRRRAIERAIGDAQRSDVVLIAGKGHETYQIVGDRVQPFDDAAVAREALRKRQALQ
jgi:UDP-N-acetylmuramoyl-L-alanyl-D-glutamate--2,6-diaminopimelate ligase